MPAPKGCDLCPLGQNEDEHRYARNRKHVVNFTLPRSEGRAKILFVGEGPGPDEDWKGRPFVGPSGRLLRYLCREAGIDDKEQAIGNLVRCWPWEINPLTRGRRTRPPKETEISKCETYLDDDIAAIDPNLIVLVGSPATKRALGHKMGVTKARGIVYEGQLGPFKGRKVLPMIHPAALLRSSWGDLDMLRFDLAKAASYCEDDIIPPQELPPPAVCRTVEDVEAMVEYLKAMPEWTFDTETESYDWWQDKMLCLSFAAEEDDPYVVPLRHGYVCKEEVDPDTWERAVEEGLRRSHHQRKPAGRRPDNVYEDGGRTFVRYAKPVWTGSEQRRVLELLRGLFDDPRPRKAAQNGRFDVHWLRAEFGIGIRNFDFDMLFALHLIRPQRPHNLEFMRSVFTNLPAYDTAVYEWAPGKVRSSFAQIPEEELWRYAGGDAICELETKHKLQQRIVRAWGSRKMWEPPLGGEPAGEALVQAAAEESGCGVDLGPPAEESSKNRGLFLLHEHAMPLQRAYIGVEEEGFVLDMDYMDELVVQYRKEIKRSTKRILKMVGPDVILSVRRGKLADRRRAWEKKGGKGREPELAQIEFTLSNPNDLRRLLFTRWLERSGDGLEIPFEDLMLLTSFKTGDCSTSTRSLMHLKTTLEGKAGSKHRFVTIGGRKINRLTVVEEAVKHRRAIKIKSSFLDGVGKNDGTGGMKNKARLSPDGTMRLHSSFIMHGTRTGRPSSTRPNLTNIPAEGAIRRLFTCPPGFDLIEADYSQIELRVLAHIADDAEFKKALDSEDVHKAVARMLFWGPEHIMHGGGCPYPKGDRVKNCDEITPGMRIKAKTFNFGLNYGRSAVSISFDFGISVEESVELVGLYMTRFPGIGRYHKRQSSLMEADRPIVENFFGRRAAVFNFKPFRKFMEQQAWRKEYGHLRRQAINMPIQGTAGDMVSEATIATADWEGPRDDEIAFIHRRLMECLDIPLRQLPATVLHNEMNTRMVSSCHDALFFHCPKAYSADAAALVKKTMEDVPAVLFGWHMPVDCFVVPYWGAQKSDAVGRAGFDQGGAWRNLRAGGGGKGTEIWKV